MGTAGTEATPRHRRARCLAKLARVAARTAPAGTCLRALVTRLLPPARHAPVLDKQPKGILHSPADHPGGGICRGSVVLTAVLGLGKPRHRACKGSLLPVAVLSYKRQFPLPVASGSQSCKCGIEKGDQVSTGLAASEGLRERCLQSFLSPLGWDLTSLAKALSAWRAFNFFQ